ncbi:hypothetical protein [Nocardia sp. CNY236]|uniref:hypothetical protein n=1 Tax=Nocardia sp. CNY236 TaxID=1169152 RepID=UPI000560F862|nr:hypothetical protein [Nocardia sp. CNY236]
MSIHLASGRTISSDLTAVSAISVGCNQWVVQQLRGRTLTLDQALATIKLAEVLPQPRPASDEDHCGHRSSAGSMSSVWATPRSQWPVSSASRAS